MTKGRLLGKEARVRIKGISTNSRSLKKGELFIAIKGERFDGHDFLKEVVKKGASALLVSSRKNVPKISVPIILVRDTTKALGDIAHSYRSRFNIPVIAITGSAGKTTTKEMIAAVLNKRFAVLKNFRTENNQYGVPLTLLKLKKSHKAVIIELGTNKFGDIRWLTKVAEPTIALFTNIGESHLEFLRSSAGVFKEKSDLVRYKKPSGVIIFNADDPLLKKIRGMKGKNRLLSFGIKAAASIRAVGIKQIDRHTLFKVGGKEFSLNTPFEHNVYNALSAISCGRLMNVPDRDIQSALKFFQFEAGRQEIKRVGKVWVIDDTYNSNPVSFQSAIKTLERWPAVGRKIIVCADMLELGKRAQSLHERMGKIIAGSHIDALLTTGRWAQYLAQSARKKNKDLLVFHSPSLKRIHQKIKSFCRGEDVVLVKGSRGMRMERTVDFLEKAFSLN